ncbi:MAG: ABC transporter permease [Candidatus Bathyarchaeota archaeon]|nr:ABC transporter permease [Candidatus Bathyarchaeota archaeon]
MQLDLLTSELRKVWGRPILELVIGFVFLMALSSTQTMTEIYSLEQYQSNFQLIIAETLVDALTSLTLPLTLFCGLLVSLSFARDYEQGLMQTLLSLPISRASIFVVKFVAVVVPLTVIAWSTTFFVTALNFYSDTNTLITVFSHAIWALPIILLALMFYAGMASMISLATRKTVPAALITLLTSFFVGFVSMLPERTIGALANYLIFTPYKAPSVALGRIIGMRYLPDAIENTVSPWVMLGLLIFYSVVLLVPTYLYFTKKFEVKE